MQLLIYVPGHRSQLLESGSRGDKCVSAASAADIGSTTTKAVVFERQDGTWVMKGKTVSPTTVESPYLDVMVGLRRTLSSWKHKQA